MPSNSCFKAALQRNQRLHADRRLRRNIQDQFFLLSIAVKARKKKETREGILLKAQNYIGKKKQQIKHALKNRDLLSKFPTCTRYEDCFGEKFVKALNMDIMHRHVMQYYWISEVSSSDSDSPVTEHKQSSKLCTLSNSTVDTVDILDTTLNSGIVDIVSKDEMKADDVIMSDLQCLTDIQCVIEINDPMCSLDDLEHGSLLLMQENTPVKSKRQDFGLAHSKQSGSISSKSEQKSKCSRLRKKKCGIKRTRQSKRKLRTSTLSLEGGSGAQSVCNSCSVKEDGTQIETITKEKTSGYFDNRCFPKAPQHCKSQNHCGSPDAACSPKKTENQNTVTCTVTVNGSSRGQSGIQPNRIQKKSCRRKLNFENMVEGTGKKYSFSHGSQTSKHKVKSSLRKSFTKYADDKENLPVKDNPSYTKCVQQIPFISSDNNACALREVNYNILKSKAVSPQFDMPVSVRCPDISADDHIQEDNYFDHHSESDLSKIWWCGNDDFCTSPVLHACACDEPVYPISESLLSPIMNNNDELMRENIDLMDLFPLIGEQGIFPHCTEDENATSGTTKPLRDTEAIKLPDSVKSEVHPLLFSCEEISIKEQIVSQYVEENEVVTAKQ